MAKKKVLTVTTERTSVVSVRFPPDEHERIKSVAEHRNVAPASFIRWAANEAAVEVFNAEGNRKQVRTIEAIAMKVAKNLIDPNVVIEESHLDMDPHGPEEVTTYKSAKQYRVDGNPVEYLHVAAERLDVEDLQSLKNALQHASRPFALKLLETIIECLDKDDDGIFVPIDIPEREEDQ